MCVCARVHACVCTKSMRVYVISEESETSLWNNSIVHWLNTSVCVKRKRQKSCISELLREAKLRGEKIYENHLLVTFFTILGISGWRFTILLSSIQNACYIHLEFDSKFLSTFAFLNLDSAWNSCKITFSQTRKFFNVHQFKMYRTIDNRSFFKKKISPIFKSYSSIPTYMHTWIIYTHRNIIYFSLSLSLYIYIYKHSSLKIWTYYYFLSQTPPTHHITCISLHTQIHTYICNRKKFLKHIKTKTFLSDDCPHYIKPKVNFLLFII